jgi:hypothetical protein
MTVLGGQGLCAVDSSCAGRVGTEMKNSVVAVTSALAEPETRLDVAQSGRPESSGARACSPGICICHLNWPGLPPVTTSSTFKFYLFSFLQHNKRQGLSQLMACSGSA